MPREIRGPLLAALCMAGLPPGPASAMAPAAPRFARGAVACGHADASRAGAEILAAGGDAVDAAIATMAGLGVATPQGSGLGGGFFALVYRADEKRTYVLDARETAPAATHKDFFRAGGRPGGDLEKDRARWGGGAVAVPGEVRGMGALHGRWGRLPWRRLFDPAIRLAREGSQVNGYLAWIHKKVRRRFDGFPAATALYTRRGEVFREGDTYRNPALAGTLEELARRGPGWFYAGGMAGEIVAATRAAGGVMTAADLAGYQVRWRAPLVGRFRGRRIVTMPLPSSGGLVLLECLGMLEGFGLKELGWNSAAYLHVLAEVMKRAYADRATEMGDADFVRVPVRRLLDRKRLRRLAAEILPHRATPVAGGLAPHRDRGTNHLSVIDGAGNVVAATTTINYGYGSLVVVPGRGYVLNNQMDDFSIAPGEANLFGLVGNEKNAVAPGKRPLSSMTPTIVFEGGRPRLALGGSGGPRIISSTLQAILNVLVFERPLQEAISAPRIHHQWKPDHVRIEPEFVRDVRLGLTRRGHALNEVPVVGGRVNAVMADEDGVLAASDPRKEGRPAGH